MEIWDAEYLVIPGVPLLELAMFGHDMSTTFKSMLASYSVSCHSLPLHVELSFPVAKKAQDRFWTRKEGLPNDTKVNLKIWKKLGRRISKTWCEVIKVLGNFFYSNETRRVHHIKLSDIFHQDRSFLRYWLDTSHSILTITTTMTIAKCPAKTRSLFVFAHCCIGFWLISMSSGLICPFGVSAQPLLSAG